MFYKLSEHMKDRLFRDLRIFVDKFRYKLSKFHHIPFKLDNDVVCGIASCKSAVVPRPDKGNGIDSLGKNRYIISMINLICEVSYLNGLPCL